METLFGPKSMIDRDWDTYHSHIKFKVLSLASRVIIHYQPDNRNFQLTDKMNQFFFEEVMKRKLDEGVY